MGLVTDHHGARLQTQDAPVPAYVYFMRFVTKPLVQLSRLFPLGGPIQGSRETIQELSMT